ncbi:MAG: ExbD/TolR family protein, partial [Pirellula sp.]
MKFSTKRSGEKAELQLTSMIDVIFLLLIFFVMTFRIVAQEGDFNIRMPLGGGAGSAENTNVPIKVRLRAHSAGDLSDLRVTDNLTLRVQPSAGDDIEAMREREK